MCINTQVQGRIATESAITLPPLQATSIAKGFDDREMADMARVMQGQSELHFKTPEGETYIRGHQGYFCLFLKNPGAFDLVTTDPNGNVYSCVDANKTRLIVAAAKLAVAAQYCYALLERGLGPDPRKVLFPQAADATNPLVDRNRVEHLTIERKSSSCINLMHYRPVQDGWGKGYCVSIDNRGEQLVDWLTVRRVQASESALTTWHQERPPEAEHVSERITLDSHP